MPKPSSTLSSHLHPPPLDKPEDSITPLSPEIESQYSIYIEYNDAILTDLDLILNFIQSFWTKSYDCCILTIFVASACAGVGAVTVVETLHLGDVQGGEDGVTGEGHARVHRGHHPLRGVDSETRVQCFRHDDIKRRKHNLRIAFFKLSERS